MGDQGQSENGCDQTSDYEDRPRPLPGLDSADRSIKPRCVDNPADTCPQANPGKVVRTWGVLPVGVARSGDDLTPPPGETLAGLVEVACQLLRIRPSRAFAGPLHHPREETSQRNGVYLGWRRPGGSGPIR